MSKPIERIVKTNGISLNVVDQGQGSLLPRLPGNLVLLAPPDQLAG
jgi:hypothetical protein